MIYIALGFSHCYTLWCRTSMLNVLSRIWPPLNMVASSINMTIMCPTDNFHTMTKLLVHMYLFIHVYICIPVSAKKSSHMSLIQFSYAAGLTCLY